MYEVFSCVTTGLPLAKRWLYITDCKTCERCSWLHRCSTWEELAWTDIHLSTQIIDINA